MNKSIELMCSCVCMLDEFRAMNNRAYVRAVLEGKEEHALYRILGIGCCGRGLGDMDSQNLRTR